MAIFVTGGAGFIGSNFVLEWMRERSEQIINVDALTYAGNLGNLEPLFGDPRHHFVNGDIADDILIRQLLDEYRPRAIIHFAAESHVDRSIVGPEAFIQTNIVGTYRLLSTVHDFWRSLSAGERSDFRFVHISTDEVYGSLASDDPAFSELSRYAPNSPYSASKAASDHLARAYFHTYGLPVVTSNCSNNYGPYQFPEKLIPLMILNALDGTSLPVYGDGSNVRDWLYVHDHCSAIRRVLAEGVPGETYNIGGNSEMANIELVQMLCDLLDELHPNSLKIPHRELITFVADRPGHDRRYAIDARKIERELGWYPQENFQSGLRKTVLWYLSNKDWVSSVTSGQYRNWIKANYSNRTEAI